jgi:hypothetical protein
MTPSTASRNLWTINPSRRSYRDHGKPHLASLCIRISTLLGPILMTYLSMTVLQDLSITQLWNVLLRSRVELLRLSVVFGSYRWLLVLLPVCRAFEPAKGSYLVRALRSRDPSRRDRDAKCNSTPRFLVDFIVPRVLAPIFGPRTWS